MLKITIYTFLLVLLFSSCQSKLNTNISSEKDYIKEEPLTIGSKSMFSSKIMGEDRPIIISLPQNYTESNADYPVLYLTDGLQNIWHTIGTVEVLTRTGSIPPMIIVGVESTNRDRDFSPTVDKNWPRSGGGPKFSPSWRTIASCAHKSKPTLYPSAHVLIPELHVSGTTFNV